MENRLNYKVHPKEQIYFVIKVVAAVLGYCLIFYLLAAIFSDQHLTAAFLPLLFYVVVIFGYLFIRFGILIGYLGGNAIKTSKNQFPQIHEIVQKQCWHLNIKSLPTTYILQSGGLLNAFATRFAGSNYIVIYSDVVEEAYENNLEGVEFIIGHELGHIKRKHVTKRLWLFPAFIIPFLNKAYSRACEYTCDNIGAALSPKGAKEGLLLLASGKKLRGKVNTEAYAEQLNTEFGFWFWFSEKVSSHPHLTKRIQHFKGKEKVTTEAKKEAVLIERPASDHSAFLPRN